MTSRRFIILSSVLALSSVLVSCGSSSSPTAELEWGACTGDDAGLEGFECATLEVPLDWSDTGGTKISIALVRLPAGGERRGAVLVNPGGPGSSGFDYAVDSAEMMVSDLALGGYDIVGFDPRGVERSAPVECVNDSDLDAMLSLDWTPDDDTEQAAYDKYETYFEDKCREKYGDDLAQYSTANTARDMDAIRAAMGDEVLNFIGVSYGTYLGGVYATLFPDRVGTMVLDAAFDPAGDTPEQTYLTQTVGFEESFDSWAAWCESDDSCLFRSRDVPGDWDDLAERLDATPLSVDGRIVNEDVLETATVQALYAQVMWPTLGSALAAVADDGDGTGILSLADAYNERREDGTYTSSAQAFSVIQCASGMYSGEPSDPEALLAELKDKAPRFSRDMTVDDLTGTRCEGLTEDAELVEIDYSGEARIVVVGGENDPATPIRWAEEMAANLGTNARLVRFSGEGHGSLLSNLCVNDIAASLFEDGTLPENGTTCDPDPVLAEPEWWSELPARASGERLLDRGLLDSAIGFADTRYWVEYRSTSKAVEDAYADFAGRLADAGFVADDPTAIEAVDTPQFFENSSGAFVGLFTLPFDEISSYGLGAPTGPVPTGHTLLAIYWYPIGD